MPDFIKDTWEKIAPQSAIAHEDAYLSYFSSPGSEAEDTTHRGFFANFDTAGQIADFSLHILYWVAFRHKKYVDSEMRDTETRDQCTKSFFYNESFLDLVGAENAIYYNAHNRFEEDWSNTYHLILRNCQHWADYVVTGVDESR